MLILVLGIVSLVCVAFAPSVWWLASDELRRIDAGIVDPATRGLTAAGRGCAIFATICAGFLLLIRVLCLGLGTVL